MVGFIIFLVFALLLPILLILVCMFKYKVKFSIVILGLLTFFISQLLIRVPIVDFINTFDPTITTSLAYKLLLPLSAGLFEVGADYIAIKYFMKDLTFKNGVCLGIAHGLCENFFVFFLVMAGNSISSLPTLGMSVSALERVSALILHISCALFAFYAVYKKKISFLILGILIHGLDDLPIVFIHSLWILEPFFFIFSVITLIFILNLLLKREHLRM